MRCWDWNLTSLAISRNPVHKWLEQSQRAASLTYSCPWKPSSCWIVSISTSMNSLNMSFYVMPKLTLANRTIKLSDLKMLLWVEELLVSMLFKDLLFPPVCYKQAPSVRPTTRNRCCVGGTLWIIAAPAEASVKCLEAKMEMFESWIIIKSVSRKRWRFSVGWSSVETPLNVEHNRCDFAVSMWAEVFVWTKVGQSASALFDGTCKCARF